MTDQLLAPRSVPAWDAEADDRLTCVAVYPETHDVKTFVFTAPRSRRFEFEPGQFLTFGFRIGGEVVSRCYTVASSPLRPHTASITIKRVHGGIVSAWLHDEEPAVAQAVDAAEAEIEEMPTYKVNFARMGREIDARADRFVLAAAREAGLRVPASCTTGLTAAPGMSAPPACREWGHDPPSACSECFQTGAAALKEKPPECLGDHRAATLGCEVDLLLGTTNRANRMKGGKATLHETLKRQILTLELAPDQDLDETSLSETYGISRTPVRDVLRQLAAEGYVDIRENRGARVIPMSHATLRDFFLVAPLIYEAVGRLAVQNFRPAQMRNLKDCQERFRSAMQARDSASMVIENNSFHAIIGEMADSAFLRPSLSKLLIDHARIGYTFFRPTNDEMETSLATACAHHDHFIQAIETSDVSSVVRLVFDHWELSRRNMEMFIAPTSLASNAMTKLKPEAQGSRKVRVKSAIT